MAATTTSRRSSTKLTIAQPAEDGVNLVGTLEQLDPDAPTQGRKIALILHGTMGHKDYLFQKRLAQNLPLDSFRFDFRGAFESGGKWKYAAFHEDLEDLRVVVRHLRETYGYVVDLVVGHSRGSVVGMLWLCTSEEGRDVGGFVNVSGRYRMDRVLHDHHYKRYKPDFDSKGHFEWEVTVARQKVIGHITEAEMHEFASIDTSVVWSRFPAKTDALTIHGLADTVVPVFDATIYARALGAGREGTHSLCLVEDGDHNLTGHNDEVVGVILDWWKQHEARALKSGIWGTGVRPEPSATHKPSRL
ncbi:unnamed protein product [Peniophora sp. CBMAI 1063]|nr:unnamed protein product [Peniophora sp. CBMAI 1063]